MIPWPEVGVGYAVARVSVTGVLERMVCCNGYEPVIPAHPGQLVKDLLVNHQDVMRAIRAVLYDQHPRTMVIWVAHPAGSAKRLARIYPGTKPTRVFVVLHKLADVLGYIVNS